MFKKILIMLSSLTVLSSSALLAVSCSSGAIIEEDIDYENANKVVELFNKQFNSEQEAIDFYLKPENGVEIIKNTNYFNEITLDNSQFNDMNEVFDYIQDQYDLSNISTNKNVDDYIMDGMNQLNPIVQEDSNSEIKVYKKADGTVSYNSNEDYAIKNVEESYISNIKEKFVVDGTEYEDEFAAREHYYQNFLNQNQLSPIDLYSFNSGSYSLKDVTKEIENTIETKFYYDESQSFTDKQVGLDNLVKLNSKDISRINLIPQTPGKYYIEAMENSDGVYLGDKIVDTSVNLEEYISKIDNWKLSDISGNSILDIMTSVVQNALLSVSNLLEMLVRWIANEEIELSKLENCFSNVDTFTYKNIFGCFSNKYEEDYESLLKNYALIGESNASLTSLNRIRNLDLIQKSVIYLYEMRESLKWSEVEKQDYEVFKEISFDIFKNLMSEITEWANFMDIFGVEEVDYIYDFLMDKDLFLERIRQRDDYQKIVDSIYAMFEEIKEHNEPDFIDKIFNIVNSFIDYSGESIIPDWILKAIKAALLLLELATIEVQAVLIFVELFPITLTRTYKLVLPDTREELEYQITDFILTMSKFDPSNLFRVEKIKEKNDNPIYSFDNAYYKTFDQAENALYDTAIEETVQKGKKEYSSKYNENFSNNNRELVIEQAVNNIKENNQISSSFTDYFGEAFLSSQEALISMEKKLQSSVFNKRYYYYYGNGEQDYITNENYDEIKDLVLDSLNIESKLVSLDDYNNNRNNFDKLYDLSVKNTYIYRVTINSLDYFFKNEADAIYYVMKVRGFKNELLTSSSYKYKFNDILFENIVKYTEYLKSNINYLEKT